MSKFISIFPQLINTNLESPVRVLGIDLGTTNSVVAEIKWDPKIPDLIEAKCIDIPQETKQGLYDNWLVPSVVAIHGDKIYIGEGAKRMHSEMSLYGLKPYKNIFSECKNDMGIRKTYHQAPEGFKTASDIGGKVLGFLYEKAIEIDDTPVDKIVITVPASFQLAQREDTIKAAKMAGLEVKGGELLDEPIAAFFDYLFNYDKDDLLIQKESKNVLVFDFGGGTCDVAILNICFENNAFKVACLAVSRYHRLGGGDIDRAIVYNCLIPKIMSSNNIGRYELSYEEKKFKLEPELLGIAEALKYKLCHEIDMLKKFGKCDESNLDDIVVKLPRKDFNIKNNKLILDCPSLTAQEFERVLKPFLDNDLLCYNENEYFISCSIFAPIQDALYHSGLAKTDIDYCLIVGGSSLIPQVKEAISKYFSLSKLLHYPDAYSNQVAVARGAAYQALCLMLFNKGLYDPVTHDSIGIRTQKGFMELIPKGVSLPYPPNGYGINNELTIPETVHSGKTDIRIEIVSGSDSNTLLKKKWSIQGPVKKGESLCLEYKYDENQVLHLLIGLANNLENSQVFEETIEKPLTYVVNPNSIRQKILEIEEEIRCGIYTGQKLYEKIKEVARLYAEIGQYERAIDLLKKILSNSHQPDVNILNLLGIYCGNIGDYERQEKFYRKAAEVSSWKGPLFNLALSFWNRGKIDQAIEIIDEVIRDEKEAPYLVLKAKLLFEQKKVDKGRALLEEAFTLFEDIELLDDWSLYWYIDAARMLKDEEKINAAKNEQRRRMCSKDDDGGLLPDLTLRLKGR